MLQGLTSHPSHRWDNYTKKKSYVVCTNAESYGADTLHITIIIMLYIYVNIMFQARISIWL